MRNLINYHNAKLPKFEGDESNIISSEYDLINDSISILSIENGETLIIKQFQKNGQILIIEQLSLAKVTDESLHFQLKSFKHLEVFNKYIIILSNGNIIETSYNIFDDENVQAETSIVGTLDSSIYAAEWSPDEEQLVVVTSENSETETLKFIIFSPDFDILSERLFSKDDLAKSKNVNVGWGNKNTQFRGKGKRQQERELLDSLQNSGLSSDALKAVGGTGLNGDVDLLRDPTMPYMVDKGHLSELDDMSINISWRGDSEFFVVNSIEKDVLCKSFQDEEEIEVDRRVLRVFTRSGELEAVSEPVDFMENVVNWRPSGNLICGIQRKAHLQLEEDKTLDLIFFEKNGLRHGEFDTRLSIEDTIIKQVSFNSSSEILAIVTDEKIFLWTTKNYHWFLKQEIHIPQGIKKLQWHQEKEYQFMIITEDDNILIKQYIINTTTGCTQSPNDIASSLVIDGQIANITPITKANVPPPIYYRDMFVDENCNSIALSKENDLLVTSSVNNLFIGKRDDKFNFDEDVSTVEKSTFVIDQEDLVRQVVVIEKNIVLLIDSELDGTSYLAICDLQGKLEKHVEIFDKIVLLKPSFDYKFVTWENIRGSIFKLTDFENDASFEEVENLPALCVDFIVRDKIVEFKDEYLDEVITESKNYTLGLTSNGKFYLNDKLVTTAVTSFMVSDDLVLFTTAQNMLQFLHWKTLNYNTIEQLPAIDNFDLLSDERCRAIERGSLLVNVSTSESSVILQAPRGNLETIYPRIMVLKQVRDHIKNLNYLKAIELCRVHRVQLDILYDLDPKLFEDNIIAFIKQVGVSVKKGEYLDLFLSCLIDEDTSLVKYKETINEKFVWIEKEKPKTEMQQYIDNKFYDASKSKVNKVCKLVIECFLSNNELKETHLQNIITAYAVQKPKGDLTNALKMISSMEEEEQKQDDLLTYLCFLSDVNLLYKTSLSIYDLGISLQVAQKSQMDPREYLPFLTKLNEMDTNLKKFTIDDYLNDHESALKHLYGFEKVSSKFIDYLELHKLYKLGLRLTRREKEEQKKIYVKYASYLSNSLQNYNEAGLIYENLNQFALAKACYINGKNWAKALNITKIYFNDTMEDTCEELIPLLEYDHNYSAIAEIYLEFLENKDQAIKYFSKSYKFDIAMIHANGSIQKITEIIDPVVTENFSTLTELVSDFNKQLNSQLTRLRELRLKKETDPFAFYDNDILTDQRDDISIVASETSTKESFFTRYTGKTSGTAKTGVSRKTLKNKRREERKKAKGKKGTIYEEEYLIQSVGRLIDRLVTTISDLKSLIEMLIRRDKFEQAILIQKNLSEVINFLNQNVVEIYNISEKDRQRVNEDTGEIYLVDEIPIPKVPEFAKFEIIDY
ncbi:hypothetical protein QEN19_002514 [Hanseniaspora menglaensis]